MHARTLELLDARGLAERLITADELRDAFGRIAGDDFGMGPPRWSSRFFSERRQARTYRVGRVLLAGDAAHVHSPIGGQGMNTGIQDGQSVATVAANGWAGRVAIMTVAPAGKPPAVVLVRPDGYVAWAADRPSAAHVRAALQWWCGPAEPARARSRRAPA